MPCHAPSSSSKTLSLLSAISLHRHVALRDLHSFPTRRSSDLVAIVRIAGIVSGGTIFCRSQLIVSGRRIALRAAGFLVDERSEEHTSELQSHHDLVCRLLLEKKNRVNLMHTSTYTYTQLR